MSQAAIHIDLTSPPVPARRRVSDLWSLVEGDMHQVETRLCEQMDSPIGRIPEVGTHLLSAGGKRLRPLLAVLVGRASEASMEHAIAAGCAAELIHTATLFHDDVVDNGNVRRGRPAARMIYGNGVAVLVGDFCLARGLELVASTGSIAMVRSLAATVTEMAEGEVAQLEGAGDPDATIASYLRVVDRKTASLMAWCSRVGGVLPGVVDLALGRFGRALGRAFQIVDDILDCEPDEGTTGKSGGRDLQEGKLTLPVLLACEANPDLRAHIRGALGEHGISADQSRAILTTVKAAGGLERARRRALAFAEEAVAELAILPASPYREALGDLSRLSVDRVA
jgi:octaprenyl-diphosphate synthase